MSNRAVVYLRMSTDDQADSPERQLSQILPYGQSRGYIVGQEYPDLAERGWDDSRPAFHRLLNDAKAKKFDVILVDEVSRLSRAEPLDYIEQVVLPLRKAGIVVDSVAEGIQDWDEITGMFLGTMRQYKASQESATLGRRTATGMLRKAKDGLLFVGRPSYGYKYVKDPEGKRIGLEPDKDHPEKAEVARRIFDAYLNRDLSVMAIVTELNSLSIPSPQGRERWVKNTVQNILKNPVYAGSYVWGKVPQGRYFRCDGGEVVSVKRGANKSERHRPDKWVIIPNRHEPLIEPALFNEVQERLAANGGRTSPSRKRSVYSLSQVLVCSHCGSAMYGTMRKSGGRLEPVYRCGSDMTRGMCAPRVVRESVILEKMAEVLQEQVLCPSERQRLEEEMHRQWHQRDNQAEQALGDLQRKVERLNGQINQAATNLALLTNRTAVASVEAKIEQWENERREAQADLERLERQVPPTPGDFLTKVERLVEVMLSGDPSLVRPVLREAISRVDLRFETVPKKKVTRYPLAGGVVHFLGCADLVSSGPGAGR
jgi:site-specific DNA recombinase